jgi:hypothetical protein
MLLDTAVGSDVLNRILNFVYFIRRTYFDNFPINKAIAGIFSLKEGVAGFYKTISC